MIRNRAQNRMVARVEFMGGRKLMATNGFIHLGVLTGAALADYQRGVPIESPPTGVPETWIDSAGVRSP